MDGVGSTTGTAGTGPVQGKKSEGVREGKMDRRRVTSSPLPGDTAAKAGQVVTQGLSPPTGEKTQHWSLPGSVTRIGYKEASRALSEAQDESKVADTGVSKAREKLTLATSRKNAAKNLYQEAEKELEAGQSDEGAQQKLQEARIAFAETLREESAAQVELDQATKSLQESQKKFRNARQAMRTFLSRLPAPPARVTEKKKSFTESLSELVEGLRGGQKKWRVKDNKIILVRRSVVPPGIGTTGISSRP